MHFPMFLECFGEDITKTFHNEKPADAASAKNTPVSRANCKRTLLSSATCIIQCNSSYMIHFLVRARTDV